MAQKEMVIFTRTFDFLTWLLPRSNDFPRVHRHSFTRRLLDAAFDLRERLEEAALRKGAARRERLALADEALAKVRMYLRLAAKWGWLSPGQYRHVSEMVSEIGRLLGGWVWRGGVGGWWRGERREEREGRMAEESAAEGRGEGGERWRGRWNGGLDENALTD